MQDEDIQEKRTAAITGILPTEKSFEGNTKVVKPTLVNYFFGRNGAGKSTIAETIRNGGINITWESTKTKDDFDLKIYDQNYIDEYFTNYEGLPGRLIFHKANDEAIKKQDSIRKDMKTVDGEIKTAAETLAKLPEEKAKKIEEHKSVFWKLSDYARKTFKKPMYGALGSKDAFFKVFLENVTTPVDHDIKKLTDTNATLHSTDLQKYDLLFFPDTAYDYESLPGSELLETVITSSSDDPFAVFINDLEAMAWVKTGVDCYAYHEKNTKGLCPFCQQELRPDFKKKIAECFDDKYAKNMESLNIYLQLFRDTLGALYLTLKKQTENKFPAVSESPLSAQIDLLVSKTQECLNVIREKIANPSGKHPLPDIRSTIESIENTIADLNKKIEENNKLYRERGAKERELKKQVWEYISFLLDDEYQKYRATLSLFAKKDKDLNDLITAKKGRLTDLGKQLDEASAEGVPTEEAMTKINDLLRHSNFQGFELREEPGKKNVYAVMRLKNGKPSEVVDELSEGERSFIAFLYFYYDVLGFKDAEENKKRKPKVVVIDDPVSSMDDSALYIIGSLVKQLADRCQKRGTLEDDKLGDSHIDQLFVLTHNVHFHRDITIGRTNKKYYETVSFYLVRKENGLSIVKPCVQEGKAGQWENYNPVKNSYYALWSEYQELASPAAVVNVMHQILEYYFIQLCGYDGESLADKILVERADKFFNTLSDGTLDTSEYNLAESMISRITSSPTVIADGHFIEDENDIIRYRDIFERIFRAMDQQPHYDMMIESVNWHKS